MNSILNTLLIKTQHILLSSQNNNVYGVRKEHSDSSKYAGTGHRVNNLEKKFLVWTGKYKTVEEVPAYVAQNVVERARNRMRIRIANYMMAATALACLGMVYLGKQAAQRGESVAQQNIEWHRRFNEDTKKEQ
ncbi:UPF0389 protein CG9231 [Tribolium castaneum]|uniref:UPF0389 protein CG9231-like Protein n=1 Tax=Tribolium castaneum TaxID=7070 RepID=D6WCW9_TRICA|nr:PREDICTED: UPF0389 protein CG9231 [Tribolium castaneum]EEZ98829.1 UPF0389 protein CG9231-like Protein [Tribolium castaneum]|eukprot:XP_008200946.1 PREDICTED: UPF0389 protein CG9231 [Tribolium castaneum]